MNEVASKGDIVVLVADKNMESAVKGVLTRAQSLRIRHVVAQIHVHIERDPGCYHKGDVFLQPFSRQFRYGMILFDRVGCGQENKSREDLERETEERLRARGWLGRSAAVVIDPELENWIWSDSPEVDRVLGWGQHFPDLRSSLVSEGWLLSEAGKPLRPKEALEWSLRRVRKPRSSAIYEDLACSVSLDRCVDPSFLKLKQSFQQWFGLRSQGDSIL